MVSSTRKVSAVAGCGRGLASAFSPAAPGGGRVGAHRRRALGDAGDLVSALESRAPEPALGGEQQRADAAGPEQVLVHLHPDEAQRVGRVVGVADLHRPGQPLGRRVERGLDGVVGALLPVPRARGPVRGTDLVGRRQRDRTEDPGVGHGRLESRLKVERTHRLGRGVRIRLLSGQGGRGQQQQHHERSHGFLQVRASAASRRSAAGTCRPCRRSWSRRCRPRPPRRTGPGRCLRWRRSWRGAGWCC